MDNIFRREILKNPRSDYSVLPPNIKYKYGQNIKYPLSIRDNLWEISEAEESIRDAFYVILATPIGTRLLRPDFGSLIPHLVGQPYTPAVRRELILYTKEAIQRWEPRVLISEVVLDDSDIDNNRVAIVIYYHIKGIQGLRDYVIPLDFNTGVLEMPASTYTVGGYPVFNRQG